MDGSDSCRETYYCRSDSETIGNHIYKYELNGNKLLNSKLLLQLPAWPAPAHNGGIIEIGPDNHLYVTVGDFVGSVNEATRTKAQNYKNGTEPYGRVGILRATQDGNPVFESILGNEFPLNLYYTYGTRNSFGMDFDPVTGGDLIAGQKPIETDIRTLVDFGGRGKYSEPEVTRNQTV